ncbi:hypothetical protein NDU88_005830 [Pleurodeles waltl]|uniref:Uncharacterized protein n=1 Tax=Pleurodeles waltl TaxID=8319 RepID=A0AAV7RQ58_PLEWA|nr:hypothetical protein NDU88_005830 [Pleurodeles waltl]
MDLIAIGSERTLGACSGDELSGLSVAHEASYNRARTPAAHCCDLLKDAIHGGAVSAMSVTVSEVGGWTCEMGLADESDGELQRIEAVSLVYRRALMARSALHRLRSSPVAGRGSSNEERRLHRPRGGMHNTPVRMSPLTSPCSSSIGAPPAVISDGVGGMEGSRVPHPKYRNDIALQAALWLLDCCSEPARLCLGPSLSEELELQAAIFRRAQTLPP